MQVLALFALLIPSYVGGYYIAVFLANKGGGFQGNALVVGAGFRFLHKVCFAILMLMVLL